MTLKTFRIRLLNQEHLQAIGRNEWHKDIIANSLESAWGKFVKQKLAPIYWFSLEPQPLAEDYDIHFEGFKTV